MSGPSMRPENRVAHGRSFGASADLYDSVRPGYPHSLIEEIVADLPGPRVCDLGAGTGKLSAPLLAAGALVTAVDPDPAALARNPAPSLLGSAEDIPLPDASQDAVTIAQAWHWLDPEAASAQIARIVRPGGRLWIIVNQLDVRVDWVLRLSRIMHAGDVYRPGWTPSLGDGFGPVTGAMTTFSTPLDVEGLVALAATRSYWLRSDEAVRSRVAANIRGYVTEELGCPADAVLDLPYLCLIHRAVRLDDRD